MGENDEINFIFVPDRGKQGSRDYTGFGKAVYVNGEIYEGDYLDGVIKFYLLMI